MFGTAKMSHRGRGFWGWHNFGNRYRRFRQEHINLHVNVVDFIFRSGGRRRLTGSVFCECFFFRWPSLQTEAVFFHSTSTFRGNSDNDYLNGVSRCYVANGLHVVWRGAWRLFVLIKFHKSRHRSDSLLIGRWNLSMVYDSLFSLYWPYLNVNDAFTFFLLQYWNHGFDLNQSLEILT